MGTRREQRNRKNARDKEYPNEGMAQLNRGQSSHWVAAIYVDVPVRDA